ncbi:MAG: ankyrin repeat domain-containing protein [Gammaproteobacteria bacterium]|nr:ankyrin repeat domain-containing protein [Gammaproteobacteria bacterium]
MDNRKTEKEDKENAIEKENKKDVEENQQETIDPYCFFISSYPVTNIKTRQEQNINLLLAMAHIQQTEQLTRVEKIEEKKLDPNLLLGGFYPNLKKEKNISKEPEFPVLDPPSSPTAEENVTDFPTLDLFPPSSPTAEENITDFPALDLFPPSSPTAEESITDFPALDLFPPSSPIAEENVTDFPALDLFPPSSTKEEDVIEEPDPEIDLSFFSVGFYSVPKQEEKLLIEQKQTIQKSAFQLSFYEDFIKQVKILLKGLDNRGEEFPEFGNKESPMLLGVRVLLQHYYFLSEPTLTINQKNQIEKMLQALKYLENISYTKRTDYGSSEFKSFLTKSQEEAKKILDEKNEVYLGGGFVGHHAIYKITREKDPKTNQLVYYRTEFNAGYDAQVIDNNLVWGTNKKMIIGDVSEIIKHSLINFHSEEYKHLPTGYLGETIKADSHAVAPQHIGNCTVRSTIEMLRSSLDNAIFKEFFYFIDKFNIEALTVEFDKINNYSQFTGLIINEAIKLSEVPLTPLLDKPFLNHLENITIQYLLKDKNFSFYQSHLLENKSLIQNYAQIFLQEELLTKPFILPFINKQEKSDLFIQLIRKYLETTLKISIPQHTLIELSKISNLIFDKTPAIIQMNTKNLIHFSCIIAELLINTNSIYSSNNEIQFDSSAQTNSKILMGCTELYWLLKNLPQSSLGKDIFLFEASKESLAKAKKDSNNMEMIILVKEVLQTVFYEKKLSTISINIATDYLAKLLLDPHSFNKLIIQKNPKDLSEKMQKGFWKYALNSQENKTLDHVKITMFGTYKEKKYSAINKYAAYIMEKYKETYGDIPFKDILRLNNLVIQCLANKKWKHLQLLEVNGEFIDNAIIRTINKNISSTDIGLELEKIIHLYHANFERLTNLDPIDDNAIQQIKSLIENKSTPPDVLHSILRKLVYLKNTEMIDFFIAKHPNIDIEEAPSLLFQAIPQANINLINWLLERVDVNNITMLDPDKNFTPLMLTYHYKRLSENENRNTTFQEIATLITKQMTPDVLKDFLFTMAQKKVKARTEYQALSILTKECKVDINATDIHKNTPLIWAAYKNNKDFVELLVEANANVNYVNPETFKTALKNAFEVKNIPIMEILMKAGANDSFEVFLLALKEDEMEIVKKMLEIKPNLINQKDNAEGTPLKVAYDAKNIPMMKCLIEHKAPDQAAILSDLINKQNIELTQSLIDWGVKGSLVHLMEAYENQNTEIIKILLQSGCPGKVDLLAKATNDGNKEIIDLIVSLDERLITINRSP